MTGPIRPMGPVEQATRARVRRLIWPDNPYSVQVAVSAVKQARRIDADGPTTMRVMTLDGTVGQLACCSADGSSKLDPLYASLARKADPDYVPRPEEACCPDGQHERHRGSAVAS